MELHQRHDNAYESVGRISYHIRFCDDWFKDTACFASQLMMMVIMMMMIIMMMTARIGHGDNSVHA